MSITESIETVKHLFKSMIDKITSGSDKRTEAAKVALEYGTGGQTFIAKEFNMSRNTIRKGIGEIKSGKKIEDKFNLRGRKKSTEKLPQLKEHIKAILDSQSQADPKFQTDRLYTNISIGEIRKQLMRQYDYTNEELPTIRTVNTIVNEMKYTVKTVKKAEPIKRIPETDMIFENLDVIHEIAEEDENTIRLSIDTKDRVKVGPFSRGGKSRVEVKAKDHDFGDKYVIPFGIMNVKEQTTDIYLSETKVTADFMVDMLEKYWEIQGYKDSGKMMLLDADNGPENSGQRTEFIKRMVHFSIESNTDIILAYYPPYHSKYNPIERVWGVLEQHWNGALLDSKDTIKKYIESATYASNNLTAEIIDKVYETGVKVRGKAMKMYEKALIRISGLEKWFVMISAKRCKEVLKSAGCLV